MTAADFWLRAVVFFAEHGITTIHRVLTDNGSCYRSHAWAHALEVTGTQHKRTRPDNPRPTARLSDLTGRSHASGPTSVNTVLSKSAARP